MVHHQSVWSPRHVVIPPSGINPSSILIVFLCLLIQVHSGKRLRPIPSKTSRPKTHSSNFRPNHTLTSSPSLGGSSTSAATANTEELRIQMDEQIRVALGVRLEEWETAKPSRGPAAHFPIELDSTQLRQLIAIANRRPRANYSPEQAGQASIILMAAAGRGNSGITKLTGKARNTVSAWRGRFCERGIESIISAPVPPPAAETAPEAFELPAEMLEELEGKVRRLLEAEGMSGFLNHPLVQCAADTMASNRETVISPVDRTELIAIDQGREYSRLALQDQINHWAPGDVGKAVVHNSQVYSHRRVVPKLSDTTVGRIVIPRMTYRNQQTKQAIVPFDELLNLPRGQKSPLLARSEVRQAALDPYEPATETVEQLTQAHVAKRTAETMMAEASIDFEMFYATRQADPATEREVIILNIDRKGIRLTKKEQRRLNLRLKEPETDEKRRGPGRPAGKKMAVVTTVHSASRYLRTVDDVMKELQRTPEHRPRPPKLHNKRVWASLEKSLNEQVQEAFEEMIKRDPGKVKDWVMLMDGERWLRDQIREVFGPKLHARFTEILDFYHVLEYLWAVANAAHPQGKKKRQKAQQLVSRFSRLLLEGKVESVIVLLQLMVDSRRVSEQLISAVADCVSYFRERIPMMRYDIFLARGYPIASGVVEGACKNLVKCRFERSGMMWTVAGAEAVLKVRSVVLNGDLDEYWLLHREAERERLYGERAWQAVGHSASGTLPRSSVQISC